MVLKTPTAIVTTSTTSGTCSAPPPRDGPRRAWTARTQGAQRRRRTGADDRHVSAPRDERAGEGDEHRHEQQQRVDVSARAAAPVTGPCSSAAEVAPRWPIQITPATATAMSRPSRTSDRGPPHQTAGRACRSWPPTRAGACAVVVMTSAEGEDGHDEGDDGRSPTAQAGTGEARRSPTADERPPGTHDERAPRSRRDRSTCRRSRHGRARARAPSTAVVGRWSRRSCPSAPTAAHAGPMSASDHGRLGVPPLGDVALEDGRAGPSRRWAPSGPRSSRGTGNLTRSARKLGRDRSPPPLPTRPNRG